MSDIKFSIIIPIYNVKNYIKRCIESIIFQDYNNYELILVDDGSTDGTSEIIEQYSNYSQIRIYHKKNEGPSKARNLGIERSIGEYLMFVDSDDMLYTSDCLEKLNKYLKTFDTEILQYKMIFLYKDKYKKIKNIFDINNIADKNLCLEILNKNGNISASPCDKVIKASLIKNNNIYFPEGMFHEDIKWSYELYMKTKNIKIVNDEFYVYRQQRDQSTTSIKSKKSADDLFKIVKFFLNYNYNSDKEKKLYYNMISYWYLILRINYEKNYYTHQMKLFFKKWDLVIIKYNDNYKVNKAYNFSKIFGLKITFIILKIYTFLKNKGIIKI